VKKGREKGECKIKRKIWRKKRKKGERKEKMGCKIELGDFYFFSIFIAIHPLSVGLGPNELKNVLKNESDPAIPCGNFCCLSP
jgi:hypothetical protein